MKEKKPKLASCSWMHHKWFPTKRELQQEIEVSATQTCEFCKQERTITISPATKLDDNEEY